MNDGMGAFIADATIKQLALAGKAPRDCKVIILGITYKENSPDSRNSKVADIIHALAEYGIKPMVVDPVASIDEAEREYGVRLVELDNVRDADCVILAVAHNEFKELGIAGIDKLFGTQEEKVLIDIKGLLDKHDVERMGYRYWRL